MSAKKERQRGEGFATLRDERITAGLSLADIARISGEQKASCHYAESYSHHIVPRVVYAYAKALTLDPRELMTRVAAEAMEREIVKLGVLPTPKKKRSSKKQTTAQA